VKAHALAQRQFDGAIVDALPGGGQSGLERQIALPVEFDQRRIDHREAARADVALLAQRRQGAGIGDLLHGNAQHRPRIGCLRLLRGRARCHQAGGGQRDQSSGSKCHRMLHRGMEPSMRALRFDSMTSDPASRGGLAMRNDD